MRGKYWCWRHWLSVIIEITIFTDKQPKFCSLLYQLPNLVSFDKFKYIVHGITLTDEWIFISMSVFYKINFRAIVFGKFEHPHSSATIRGNFWHEKGRLVKKKEITHATLSNSMCTHIITNTITHISIEIYEGQTRQFNQVLKIV